MEDSAELVLGITPPPAPLHTRKQLDELTEA
jgi:hypothetical protein